MKAVVVYESMYGNTHLVADAIADGVRGITGDEVVVTPVDQADDELLVGTKLLLVGGPTHVHGMSRVSTRHAAVEATEREGSASSSMRTPKAPAGATGSTRSAISPPWWRRSTPGSRDRRR